MPKSKENVRYKAICLKWKNIRGMYVKWSFGLQTNLRSHIDNVPVLWFQVPIDNEYIEYKLVLLIQPAGKRNKKKSSVFTMIKLLKGPTCHIVYFEFTGWV